MGISPPNYTQTPNILFDKWLPHLGEVELKVLMVIIRKTFGYHKQRDRISISQLVKMTGSIRKNVIAAAESLRCKNIISKIVVGEEGFQETYYEIIFEDSNNSTQCQIDTPPSIAAIPPPSIKLIPTKDRVLNKIINKKDNVLAKDHAFEKFDSVKAHPDPVIRYKLNETQSDIYRWLRKELPDADIHKVAYWAKHYQIERLMEVAKASKFKKNPAGYMAIALKQGYAVVNDKILENKQLAEDYKKANVFDGLEIFEKHVRYMVRGNNRTIEMNMSPDKFLNLLLTAHEDYLRQ